jgi:hypothetical protein
MQMFQFYVLLRKCSAGPASVICDSLCSSVALPLASFRAFLRFLWLFPSVAAVLR